MNPIVDLTVTDLFKSLILIYKPQRVKRRSSF